AKECQQRGLTYASPLRAKVRLVLLDREVSKPTIKEVKEQEAYMGEIPLITGTGSFVINRTERVLVSQLHPSPGRFCEQDRGMTPESILAHFFDFDNFEIKSEGGMIEFVPERWKGEMARFDISDRDGNVIVEKDKRINAKHLRDMANANIQRISVPEEFLYGR